MTTLAEPTKTVICPDCRAKFDYQPTFVLGKEILAPARCQQCTDAIIQGVEKRRQAFEQRQKEMQWLDLCPPEYRSMPDTAPKRYFDAVNKWSFSKIGLGIVGLAGTTKTKTAFAILRKAFLSGYSIYAISAKRFGACAVDLYRDDYEAKRTARRSIDKSKYVDVLLLDDLGKGTITERAEEELNDLLEIRTAMHRQTIWTSNHDGDQLASLFSADRRDAIMRRLIEFSVIL